MRKTVRLILLSLASFSLVSCNTNSPSKKSKKSETTTTSQTSGTTQSSSSSEEEKKKTSDSTSSSTPTPAENSITIGTTGSTLPSKLYGGSGESGGVALDDSANRTEFKNYINGIAKFDLVESFNPVNKVYFNTDGNTGKEHVNLTLGTGSYEGKMTMNLTKAVSKIEVEYSAYFKVTATGTPYDEEAVLYIEDEKYEPTITETMPEPKEIATHIYSTPSTSIYLTNDNGDLIADGQHRVFIYSIKLYF